MDINYASENTINNLVKKIKSKFCKINDIIDDCASADIDKPLSANQGMLLNEKIDEVSRSLNIATTDEIKEFLGI